ncbi:peptidoglycan DD-metalloendopeptidase family protein [Ferrimonas pelagia]|uniref:Peptidoglycan DD-metalloendopeptidase family protein n=1 Tax=Ferrimonas pelagia TaxID=1177826 RepID=A0ABP9FBG2_9GAMM
MKRMSARGLRAFMATLSVVLVVGCSLQQAPAPVSSLHTGSSYRERAPGSISGPSYTVKRGDTLYSIAWAADQDFRSLARRNQLDQSYTIYPGQILQLAASKKKSTTPVSSASAGQKSTKPSVNAPSEVKATVSTPTRQVKTVVDPTPQPRYAGAMSSQTVNKQAAAQTQQTAALPTKVSRWQWPTSGQVIRGFSSAEQGNKGLDIAAAEGTPVVSAATGRVVYAGSALRGYGKLIIVKHSDDYLSAYAHNKRILVKEKQQVSAGEKIAEVGKSDADRAMLHFEIRYQGKSVDPMRYLPRR